MNYNFEWDPKKAKSNIIKHKVSFESATFVFKDKNAISIYDEEHSINEDRWITIGLDDRTKTLIVVHIFISINRGSLKTTFIRYNNLYLIQKLNHLEYIKQQKDV